ncbi:uncharacterized protein LOC119339404 [Triticum dicoccoides]|uniref:uncharacterized protein LOC119339404 n=1 Tax=Triticum dicoccoides TaxID=85692 RepID=UPI00189187AE|nr:uncharacterized protein LOC119339404 [Triticum dicoccoides]
MEKDAMLVCMVLGFLGSVASVEYNGTNCVYRSPPATGLGILGVFLVFINQVIIAAYSSGWWLCLCCCCHCWTKHRRQVPTPSKQHRHHPSSVILSIFSWVLTIVAMAMFIVGVPESCTGAPSSSSSAPRTSRAPSILVTGFVGTAITLGCFSGTAIIAKRRDYLYLGGPPSSGMSILRHEIVYYLKNAGDKKRTRRS